MPSAVLVNNFFLIIKSFLHKPDVPENKISKAYAAETEDTSSGKKINVMASFYPMYDFATKVGGEEKKCTEHLHLKCIRCGKVVHLDCDFMDEFKEHLYKDHGFRLHCSGDMLHGIFQDCENKKISSPQS